MTGVGFRPGFKILYGLLYKTLRPRYLKELISAIRKIRAVDRENYKKHINIAYG